MITKPYNSWWWNKAQPVVGGSGITPLSPLLAPDDDFLHWLDFSDDTRLVKQSDKIIKMYFTKVPDVPSGGNWYSEGGSTAPKFDVTINSLQAGDFDGTILQLRGFATDNVYAFSHTSMTWFAIVRPKTGGGGKDGYVISDYDTGVEICFLRIGDASNLQVSAKMRDSNGDFALASSGTQYLSVDTDYLIVIKFDAVNHTVHLWIDGATHYEDTNVSYDNTTTWEGTTGRVTLGELSKAPGVVPYDGYIGSIFITKTALSNSDINRYAQWMANKWGTTWTALP